MRYLIVLLTVLLLANCAGKSVSSHDAQGDLESEWSDRVGKATKSEFIETFGNAEWCRPNATRGETCRFYRLIGEKWMGDELNRKNVKTFDEVIAEFDGNGLLRSFKAKAQR